MNRIISRGVFFADGVDFKGITYTKEKKENVNLKIAMMVVDEIGYCSICSDVVIGEITLEYTDGTIDTGWYGYNVPIR